MTQLQGSKEVLALPGTPRLHFFVKPLLTCIDQHVIREEYHQLSAPALPGIGQNSEDHLDPVSYSSQSSTYKDLKGLTVF